MVVSEMNERLSPKKAPPTTAAAVVAMSIPVSAAIPLARGIMATIVPTLVPTANETMQEAMKRPPRRKPPGITDRVRFTIASMAPACFAVAANAPARMKIHIMSRTFLSPAPEEKQVTFSFSPPGNIRKAYPQAIMKAAEMGIL